MLNPVQSVLLGGILDLVCRLFVHRTVAECSLLTSVIILVSLCEPVAAFGELSGQAAHGHEHERGRACVR